MDTVRLQKHGVVVAGVVIALVVSYLAGLQLYTMTKEASKPHWMSQLQAQYDPGYDEAKAQPYVLFRVACSATTGPGGQIMPSTQFVAYAKADVDFTTGKLKVFEYKLPDNGFKCPKVGAANLPPVGVTPGPPQTPPPAKK